MTFFQQFGQFFRSLWRQSTAGFQLSSPALSAVQFKTNTQANLKRLQELEAALIFERKKSSRQLQKMRREIDTLKQDLDEAAHQNKEELGIKILARLDEFNREEQLLKQHVDKLIDEISKIRVQREQLKTKAGRLDSKMARLKLREEILGIRKHFAQESQATLSSANELIDATEPLEEEFERLEAQMESLEPDQGQVGDDLAKMRTHRSESDLQRRFAAIRNQVLDRRLLLGEIRKPITVTAR